MPPYSVQVSLLISLKRGDGGKDRHKYQIKFQNSSGEIVEGISGTFVFEAGPSAGVDISANANLQFDREGTYWIELWVDHVRMTRLPLNVRYITQKAQGPSPGVSIQ